MRVSSLTILYNPDNEVLENINTYKDEVDTLYIVDNSEVKNEYIIKHIKQIEKVIYIDNHGNKGVAVALNTGAERAIKDGAKWLLTMDQDSRFLTKNFLKEMLKAEEMYGYNNIAIIAPILKEINDKNTAYNSEFSVIPIAITSGSLLNLETFKAIGKFREDFFIDYIDHEYCLRARMAGYIILQANKVALEHTIGKPKLYGKHIVVTHHSPTRRYYITRNRLITMNLYKDFDYVYYNNERYAMIADLIKIILYEKHKISKLKTIYKGYRDYLKNYIKDKKLI